MTPEENLRAQFGRPPPDYHAQTPATLDRVIMRQIPAVVSRAHNAEAPAPHPMPFPIASTRL